MDKFDLKLLEALQQDGRLTNNDLAERIGLSPSQCSRRRAALEEAGVIEGYHAALSNQALGLDVTVFIQVGLATQSPDSADAFGKLRQIDPKRTDREGGDPIFNFAKVRRKRPPNERGLKKKKGPAAGSSVAQGGS